MDMDMDMENMDMENMDMEDMNNSKKKLYERLKKNRERFRSRDLTKRRKKRHATIASTRRRNLKHKNLMRSRRSNRDASMRKDAASTRKRSQLIKEDEAKEAASKLVHSLGYSDKNIPVKILNTDVFNRALSQAIEESAYDIDDIDDLDYYISSDHSDSSYKGLTRREKPNKNKKIKK